jgi:hypothetical protein
VELGKDIVDDSGKGLVEEGKKVMFKKRRKK